jgi:purine-nucleoside phosphorylase
MSNLLEKVNETASFIKSRINIQPEISIVLGSGLGELGDQIENPTIIKYEDIPHFPVSKVEGHKGQLVIGTLCGKKVIAMQGRFHFYEGYPIADVTYGVRTFKAMGINTYLVTNAAGSVNKDYKPGDLMIIKDHINNMGVNPLIGENISEWGPRFPDMSYAYDRNYIKHAEKCAAELGIDIKKGVYCANSGPSYETPAEVKMMGIWGADTVGMSTVPEVIAAVHSGMRVLGISCVTNMAAGILDQPLSHDEVIETTIMAKDKFIKLMKRIVETLN